MPASATRRGYHPDDRDCFSGSRLAQLRSAHEELRYLLDRGYSIEPATLLIGNHYQLTARQRIALMRSTASRQQCQRREAARLERPFATEPVLIDGLNLIITLETALSQSLLLLGDDGVLRDLASLRGSYRIISRTETAIGLIGSALQALGAKQVVFYLDSPVSNSGKLRQLILSLSAGWEMAVSCELTPDPDARLSGRQAVISGDSRILDRCRSWINLASAIVSRSISDAWIINLSQ